MMGKPHRTHPGRGRLWYLPCLAFLLAACVRPQGVVTPPPALRPASVWRVYLPLVRTAHRKSAAYPPPEPSATPLPAVSPSPSPTPAPTPTPTPVPITLNFCASLPGNALPIPDSDFQGVQSALPVAYDGRLVALQVQLDIAHTWVGDLEVTLSHDGKQVTLLDRPGKTPGNPSACPGNDVRALFDDDAPVDAAAACSETSPAIAGTVRPAQSLRAFAGQEMGGEWVLTVRDLSEPDEGALTGWCLVSTVQK